MRKFFLFLLLVSFTTSSFAQEAESVQRTERRGDAAGFSSRDATVFSIMGWGVVLAVGIATLCALMDNNTSSGGHSH